MQSRLSWIRAGTPEVRFPAHDRDRGHAALAQARHRGDAAAALGLHLRHARMRLWWWLWGATLACLGLLVLALVTWWQRGWSPFVFCCLTMTPLLFLVITHHRSRILLQALNIGARRELSDTQTVHDLFRQWHRRRQFLAALAGILAVSWLLGALVELRLIEDHDIMLVPLQRALAMLLAGSLALIYALMAVLSKERMDLGQTGPRRALAPRTLAPEQPSADAPAYQDLPGSTPRHLFRSQLRQQRHERAVRNQRLHLRLALGQGALLVCGVILLLIDDSGLSRATSMAVGGLLLLLISTFNSITLALGRGSQGP